MKQNSNMTLVTALFDIKRGDLSDTGFGRKFDHYVETFKRLLGSELPMVIFCDEEVEKVVWEIRDPVNTKVVKKTLDDLRAFPFYTQTNAIRQRDEWRNRAGWLPDSPQSQLELYNPLVMSKQFWLNDASIFNFFDTKYFFWVDAGIANTIGDPTVYFSEEHMSKLTRGMTKMTYITYPYDGQTEIHGFPKAEFNEIAGVKDTDFVARGGMFGGPKHAIGNVNDLYYRLLDDTLNRGLMGTEESIFTLMIYQNRDMFDCIPIDNNGLIITALERLRNNEQVTAAKRLATYTLVFNLPQQFEMWAKSFKSAFPSEFESVEKYVINNSTDESVDAEYQQMFLEYGCKEIKMTDNLGICGGRQFVAEHFMKSDHEYMVFFEDDMLLQQPGSGPCKSGFTTYHDSLFEKAIEIMELEDLDYLKLAFSEFYGVNHDNWAFKNVPMEKKEEYFPAREDGRSNWTTKVHRTGTHRGLPYSVGEYHYCNWPLVFNKRGTHQLFLSDRYEHLYEQTWMSLAMNYIRAGKLKTASLLATTINHNRVHHYDGDTRRENEHYTN